MIAQCLSISMAVSKFYPTPLIPPKGSKVKYLNFAITKAVVNIFACRQRSNRYETYITGF